MLRELHIENLALIDDLWLEFGPGLSVLTGETGAGKTVLLSALQLVMGGRADTGQISAGADKARVEAVFERKADTAAGQDLSNELSEGNFSYLPDEDITVSRTMTAAGRTRVVLCGELSSVGALQKQIGILIDLHGQHDHQALLSPSKHGEYLDRWARAEIEALFIAYTEARELWALKQSELKELQDLLAKSLDEAEAGRIALADIEALDPTPGEDDDLRGRLPALQNSERIADLMSGAQEALRGEGSALERLYDLDSALEQVAVFDASIQELRSGVAEVRHTLEGFADSISDYAAQIQHDSGALESAFERLSQLESLAKRYGPTLDAVLARKERLLLMRDVSENSDDKLFEAREAEASARKFYEESAQALASARRCAAKDFITSLSKAAADLELGKVRFDFKFTELPFEQWTTQGSEKSEILYAPAPTHPSRPLVKIASGGEISRVMLALKSVLGTADSTEILIFDEVDAGIGGATGLAIGAKLRSLAASHQVIVVTHLAQVAAFADAHFKVSKESVGTGQSEKIVTQVIPLSEDERTSEIARMLSGSQSETALTHARELLASVK